MMKTLSEIIEECKDGKRPEYDELRFAVLALAYLHTFDSQDMLEVLDKCKDDKAPFALKWRAEESFRRKITAMATPPAEYLGDNWNPDSPVYQNQRKVFKQMLDDLQKFRQELEDQPDEM